MCGSAHPPAILVVPPSGGSLEIGNVLVSTLRELLFHVPPSGGSLEIGNPSAPTLPDPFRLSSFPLRGDP